MSIQCNVALKQVHRLPRGCKLGGQEKQLPRQICTLSAHCKADCFLTAGPRVNAGLVMTFSPVVVGSQRVISTIHLLQEVAQLAFIQVQAVQNAALLDQVDEQD